MDDYPNDGLVYDEYKPTEQEIEARQEEEQVFKSYPVLDQLIEKFEQDIKDADSISGLGITSSMPTLQAQIIMEGNTKYIANLNDQVAKLKEWKERYKL